MQKLGYILGWIILAPFIVISVTLVCPFILTAELVVAAKNSWPKDKNYGLTPPPKEVIILN